jgi:hypothetical protein
MKIVQVDPWIYIESTPNDAGVTYTTRGLNLRAAHSAMIDVLRHELDRGAIDLAQYTIFHLDLARLVTSPAGRRHWPARHPQRLTSNAASYLVVDNHGCDCGTCQEIRRQQDAAHYFG